MQRKTVNNELVNLSQFVHITSGKRTFGQVLLVPAVIWAGTKGLATSSLICPPARETLVPVRFKPLVPV
jgi:hypothetical protein